MPRQQVRGTPEPDYKVDQWDSAPLPAEPSGDPTSLSGSGGGMFTEMGRAFRLGLALSPLALLGAYGLAQWATGLVNNRAERNGIRDAIFYDDELLETRRDRIMTEKGQIIEFKSSFSEIEKPSTSAIVDFEKNLREREGKWRKQAILFNAFRAGVIKQARQIGESEESFPKAIDLEFEQNPRRAAR